MSSSRTFFNPAHVRSVRLAGSTCVIEPVYYHILTTEGKRTFTHDLDPEAYAACVGVFMFLEKQRVQTHV